MKLILYMAISVDGLITRGESDSDWVLESDWEQFNSYIEKSDGVIMGRKTMDEFENDFPIKGLTNIVLSGNENLHKHEEKRMVLKATPNEVFEIAKQKGFKNLLLIGGAETNKQFLEEKLIDEIILSVHPNIIGDGLRLFGDGDYNIRLKLLGTKSINNELVQIKYKVEK